MLELLAKVPFFGGVIAVWLQIAFLVVHTAIDQEVRQGGGNGVKKKEEAVKQINDVINNPGGPDWPAWMPVSAQGMIVSGILELFLLVANKAGFSNGSKPG